MSKFCPNCGNPLEKNIKFCPECGTKITPLEKQALEEDMSPTDYQYNNVEDLIEPINNKKGKKKSKKAHGGSNKEMKTKKKGGCLKKFLILIGVVFLLFVGLIMLIDTEDTDSPATIEIEIDNDYSALDALTGFDFYNLDAIPCLETDDEFNELYIPYMIRGIAERYRTTEYFGDIIFSDAFIDGHSDQEWYDAVGAYSEMWAQVEYYAKTMESLLSETNFSATIDGQPNRFSAEYFMTAYADEKVDWDEVGMYLQDAEASKSNPAVALMHHMGLSSEKAKKVARTYWYQQTRQKLNIQLDKEANKATYKENLLKVVNYTGKGASVIASISTFGSLSLINQVGVFLCTTDTIVDMGEQTSTYLFGKKNNVVSAYLLHLRDKVTSKGGLVGSILSFNPNNLSKSNALFDRTVEAFNLLKFGYDTGSDINKGKILGMDFASEKPNAFIPKDKADLLEKLKSKGVELNDKKLSQEAYEQMKATNSWLDADADTKEAYMNMRDLERIEEKEMVDEEEAKSLMDDAIQLYDDFIAGTDLEPVVYVEKEPAKNELKDNEDTGEKTDDNQSIDDSEKPSDTSVNDGTSFDDSSTDSSEDINYDDYEDQGINVPEELLRNDPLTARVWARLTEMDTIEYDVIDEIMSDIVWNITLSDNGKISVEDMERIFKERSQPLYEAFKDLMYEEEEVPIVDDSSDNSSTPATDTSTPPSDDSTSSTDPPPSTSDDTDTQDDGSGTPPKAEKEFLEFQAAQSYYESLPEGPEKDQAYREAQIKYQVYMNALKQ